MPVFQTIFRTIQRWFSQAAVTPVPVGLPDDGMTYRSAGTSIDKPWNELYREFEDAREAWRKNPLARRIVGLITSYTVGNGITFSSEIPDLHKFLVAFWDSNQMNLRIDEWSDELSRSGELFPVLFTDTLTGLSSVRAVPASMIEAIEVNPEDYESEIRYKQTTPPGVDPKFWNGPASETADNPAFPLMLHYAVNRPVGAVRGESDLAPILPWLRRYSRWLEDRVRLNAAVRAFLWIVHAPARMRADLQERYRTPPEPGTVIIAEKEYEDWTAVTPNLHAADAEKDGRAIRWMIVSGGPGIGLIDIGEGEDANQATASVMQEQRRRFLRRRQSYLIYLLSDLLLHAYQRSKAATFESVSAPQPSDLTPKAPDISPEDNNELATAALSLMQSLQSLLLIAGESDAFKRMSLRLFAKFAGENISDAEFNEIITTGVPVPRPQPFQPSSPPTQRQQSNGEYVKGPFD